ncbi:DEAD/DEAH box helicase family protein [Marinobacter hydrocarbonoclasticus]|uniref:DEAD/DEAH box helicase n=1 Tax=Marinobacter nauticus TaxID=2743 RepID=UPI001A8E1DC3|nr:DEAD/DEAH box helicase family protein [Marinobacter nauticus]MBN8241151.1 DEAD/DEAH box helicase family protein [Marinobacter nauticus]
MMQLRAWQSECIAQALKSFEHRSHFLCCATPAAGKTVMVASVAKALFERGNIDFVVCFSPSRAVAQSVATTFSQILGRSFNGRIGAAGGSYTYQSMSTLPSELWRVLSDHRVLVVLDEIHHCSGSSWDEFSMGNSWGRIILNRIQGKASYTIALSGTPWRTDDNPIVLARYTQPDGELHCDYEYGLQRAVLDRVCRAPNIVLTDNREIHLKSSELGLKTYSSIRDTIRQGHISYPNFLYRNEVIDHTLSEASKKLLEIRERVPAAAGLVVAATVAHAEQIADRLSALGERPVVVTCRTPEAHQIINNFRTSCDRWIISVGMISEGTDIPRLQVCCHLSRIRTELHFRQVLGRILRRQAGEPPEVGGWLYVLAESSLTEFARRINDDLPEQNVVSFSPRSSKQNADDASEYAVLAEDDEAAEWGFSIDATGTWLSGPDQTEQKETTELSMSNHYWSEILSLFEDRIA